MNFLFPNRSKKHHPDLNEEQKLCQAYDVPIRYAVHHGVITMLRRRDAHRNSCIQAYRQKGLLVKHGKGHNTLGGIPAVWLS